MEEKGKLGARNWDFLDHTNNSDSELDPPLGIPIPQPNVSEYQGAFLKMNAYSPDHESSSMEFSWVPPRNFLAPTQDEETKHQLNATSNHVTCKQKGSTKKKSDSVATKTLRPKAPKKKKVTSGSVGRREKKSQEDPCDGSIIDFTSVPSPVCTCTGVARQSYRWGAGGWQSSCCTLSVSEYPLPMSSSRPGSRLSGRKMSIGAYSKLLKRLANEGCDLSFAIDLKDHWSRHGTNKFVTIK